MKVMNYKSMYYPILIGMLLSASISSAAKLFAADVTYGDPLNPATTLVEDESFPNLMDDLFNRRGAFSFLGGQDIQEASIRYYAIPGALNLRVQELPSGTFEVQLTSSLTSLNETFTATSSDDLADQIVDWIFLDGGDEAIKFIREVSIRAAVAVTDGNPGSTTAKMADSAFNLFGFYTRNSLDTDMRGHEKGAFFGVSVIADTYDINTLVGDMTANMLQIAAPLWLHFNSRLSYVGQLKANSISIEGTDFYGLGLDAGFAIRPVLRTGEDRFGWQITPFIGGSAVGSIDGVTGALVYHYGLNNRFEMRLFERSLLSFVTQYSPFGNLTLNYDDYNLNANVDQEILKNGLRIEVPLFSLKSLYCNVSIIDTRFLEEAKSDNYQTFGTGLGYYGKRFSVNANVGFDYTDDYKGAKYDLALTWDL